MSTKPIFTLKRYNPRRHARGVEAAEVQVEWPDGDVDLLWMSRVDIRLNIAEHGESEGLTAALNAYANNLRIDS